MIGENECGCRLPCGICMVTNRKCPMSIINDLVYGKDDVSIGGVHLTDSEYLHRDEKLTEEVKSKVNKLIKIKAKMNELTKEVKIKLNELYGKELYEKELYGKEKLTDE